MKGQQNNVRKDERRMDSALVADRGSFLLTTLPHLVFPLSVRSRITHAGLCRGHRRKPGSAPGADMGCDSLTRVRLDMGRRPSATT